MQIRRMMTRTTAAMTVTTMKTRPPNYNASLRRSSVNVQKSESKRLE
jgi:hypothetical protein